MPEASIYKNIMDCFQRKSRKLLAGITIFSSVFAVNLSVAPDAHAIFIPGMYVPQLYIEHFMDIQEEIADFDPHYNFPLFYVAPSIYPLARKPWCLPQWSFFGVCLPPTLGLGKGWCEQFYQCTATNAFNLAVTLEIKYSDEFIGRNGRDDDVSTTRPPAVVPDYTARDACIRGAKLGYEKFDPQTGELITDPNIPASRYDESATGKVLGPKPDVSGCMRTIDTPKIDTLSTTTGNAGFTYYMNAGNYPFVSAGNNKDAPPDIYGNSNRYISTTFFLGGALGCPDSLFTNDPDSLKNPKTAADWKAKAEKCYNYFVFERASHPDWVLERPGASSDDPLTQDDPEEAIYNSCQTLMNGKDATLVQGGASPNGKGFAAVLQYSNRPDLDEADYSVGYQLKKDFLRMIPGQTPPTFKDVFPCVSPQSDGGTLKHTDWTDFNNLLEGDYVASYLVEAGVLGKELEGPVLFKRMQGDFPYASPGIAQANYCPNVERILSPSSPFSPRDDIKPDPSADDLILSAFRYSVMKDNDATKIYRTDRQYSYQTSWYSPDDRIFRFPFHFNYSGWVDVTQLNDPVYLGYMGLYAYANGMPDMARFSNSSLYPEVQCAIVPVDILEPRREAFNSCIMQRIDYNFVTMRRHNFLSFYYKNTLADWKKPCVTRFWETDSFDDCPVSMSIQQCCRIIVKDVVPINHLKIRTCEGLRQKRKLIFGYDHIYDASQVKIVSGPDQAAIDAAQNKLNTDQAAFDARVNGYLAQGGFTATSVCIALGSVGAPYPSACTSVSINIYSICTDPASCDAACHGYLNGGWDNDCMDIQNGANGYVPLIKDNPGNPANAQESDWHKLSDDKAALAAAKQLVVTTTTDNPTDSFGGKYIATPTDQASYTAAYKENQKLNLIGCDGTEPYEYRFSNYFKLSAWSYFGANINSAFINQIMNKVIQLSDGLINSARDYSMTEVLNGVLDTMWGTFNNAKDSAMDYLSQAHKLSDELLVAQKNLTDRINNGQAQIDALDLMNLGNGNPATVPRILWPINDPTGQHTLDVLQDFGVAQLELAVVAPVTKAVSTGVYLIDSKAQEVFADVENLMKDGIQLVLDKREEYLGLAKTKADDVITQGVLKLQDYLTTTVNVGSLVDSLMAKVFENDSSTLVASVLGEGGSHMPYMRWWDTGTSAGNPVHGGSFINTLGSYDTIIGVGREERDYFDSVQTTSGDTTTTTTYQCTKSTRDQAAVDAAQNTLDQYIADNTITNTCYSGDNPYDCSTYPDPAEVARLKGIWQTAVDSAPIVVTTSTASDCQSEAPDFAAYDSAKAALDNYITANTYDDICYSGDNEYSCPHVPDPAVVAYLTSLANTAYAAIIYSPATIVNSETDNNDGSNTVISLDAQQSLTQTSAMGRIGGWAELKAHQMWTTRRSNLACIGRYEKLFKPGGQEDFVLAKAGANYTSQSGVQWPWPLGWRGYVNDPNNEFEQHIYANGLDNAQKGDIIIYKVSGMKRIAYVAESNQSDPRYVRIQSWDNSKFPTSTGSGISWGMGVDRTIYKGSVPPDAQTLNVTSTDAQGVTTTVTTNIADMASDKVAKIGDQPSCEDPSFTACILGGDGNSGWDDVEIYRPIEDTARRQCPMANFSTEAPNVQTADLTTNNFAYCVNAGFDPPAYYQIGYNGQGTGQISDNTICGPGWTDCSTTSQAADVLCFPGGTQCTANVADTAALGYGPTGAPPASTCTDAEWEEARQAYEADMQASGNTVSTVNTNLENAQKALEDANAAYNTYYDSVSNQVTTLNNNISTAKATGGTPPQKAAVATAESGVNLAYNDLYNVKKPAAAAAQKALDDYDAQNKTTLQADSAILEGITDPKNLTPQQQAASDQVAAINAGRATLAAAVSSTGQAAATSQSAYISAQTALDTAVAAITTPGTPAQSDVDALKVINDQLASLQKAVDDAKTALAAAQAAADAAQGTTQTTTITNPDGTTSTVTTGATTPAMPAMTCPYVPVNNNP